MGLLAAFNRIRGGYPGGWKKYARGTHGREPIPFVPPTDPSDRRSLIPPLGLQEYWYPAIPARDVSQKKPVGLKMLGKDLVFFRDREGAVQCLWDYCPHRGAMLSWGDCYWKGFLSCPYHGATFDGDGNCVEFITEGPDSKMVGKLTARKYPTRTLKGTVFVWMGDGQPAPIEEDVPPELFDESAEMLVLTTYQYWHCNWMIALENTNDAHNCWYVHRNAVRHLFSGHTRLGGGRPRTPVGYSSKIVNDRVVTTVNREGVANYYAKDGKLPYQMYYPRVGGYWPLHRGRLLWAWLFEFLDRHLYRKRPFLEGPEEWRGGMHLPGMQRLPHLYTRYCVPVEENLTRVIYFRSRRIKSKLGRLYERVTFKLIIEWLNHYNFSNQDYDAMGTTRWQYPEVLSPTDSFVIAERLLIATRARRPANGAAAKSGSVDVAPSGDALPVTSENG
ncbi:MAG TPA: Rieske 2Fe-2S domain-containing protein [Chloroflexota bacterium]|nr:Rieske 2Fe-2S domain-containing protein [Chloroflexota bacterium]